MAQGQCKKSVFPAEFFIAINLINKQISGKMSLSLSFSLVCEDVDDI